MGGHHAILFPEGSIKYFPCSLWFKKLTPFANTWELPLIRAFAAHDSSSPFFLCFLCTTCCNIDSFAAGKNNTGQLFLSSKLNFVVNWLASWPCRLLTSTRASKIDGFQQPSWCTEAFRSIFCYWRNTKFLCSTLFSRLRRWWVGRPANTQLEDNVCRSKEPKRQRVHKMWIQFQGRIDDYGSRKPIELKIHSSNKPHRLTGTHPSRKFPWLFKFYTRKEQSYQGCSHSGKAAARWPESEVSNYHWEFIPSDLVKNTAQTAVQQEWFSVINTKEPQWMWQFGNYWVGHFFRNFFSPEKWRRAETHIFDVLFKSS